MGLKASLTQTKRLNPLNQDSDHEITESFKRIISTVSESLTHPLHDDVNLRMGLPFQKS